MHDQTEDTMTESERAMQDIDAKAREMFFNREWERLPMKYKARWRLAAASELSKTENG